MKKYLENLIKRYNSKIKELEERADASDSLEEVKKITAELKDYRDSLNEAIAQLDALNSGDDKQPADPAPASGNDPAAGDEGRSTFNPMKSYKMGGNEMREIDDDPTNTIEYRKAFKDYVMTGKKSAALAEARADANTLTSDVSAVIPTVLVNKIVEKMENIGHILPLVTKTNYAAGVEIPVASMKPVATWVSEGNGSDAQKYAADKITFTHYKLRCEVSISMEVGTMALAAFEAKIVETVAKAIVRAEEQAIISGTGTGQPKGILSETPATGQAIKSAKNAALSYADILAAEGALPEAYDNGAKWFMSKKTFYAFQGVTDANGQPVARVNIGLDGKISPVLLGREVIYTGEYMPSFDPAASTDTTVAFLFNPADYALNTIYDMGISKRQDWDTEDMQTKAVTAVDGKVIDVNSLVTLTVVKAGA